MTRRRRCIDEDVLEQPSASTRHRSDDEENVDQVHHANPNRRPP